MPQLDRFTILTYQKFFPLFLKVPTPFVPVLGAICKRLLKVAYFVQEKTGSQLLREFLNNMYWFNYAITDRRLLKRLLYMAPQRLFKLLGDNRK